VLAERNAQIKAEVADLKHGLTALEERARNDLGMVAVNETFYQVVDATSRAPGAEATLPDLDAGVGKPVILPWAGAPGS
jgi:hypothetical protein